MNGYVHLSMTIFFVGTVVGLSSCSSGPKLAPVEGVVSLNGRPIGNLQVEFWPEAGSPRSIGVTDEQGHFTLKTDTDNKPGAILGAHRVVIHDLKVYEGMPFRSREDENIKDRPSRTPYRYADALKTPLRATIENRENKVELKLEPR